MLTQSMQTLTENMLNAHGEYGQKWLDNLSKTVQILATKWNLHSLQPIENMTWNYVAKATSKNFNHVVLKIGCQPESYQDEKKALLQFYQHASVSVLDYDDSLHGLLIEEIKPGETLLKTLSNDSDFAIKQYTQIVNKLTSANQNKQNQFAHCSHWLQALDNISKDKVPHEILQKGIELKNKLLKSTEPLYILHGDLHLENIIQNKNSYISIDPKGIVGSVAFEAAKFDFLTENEMQMPKSEIKNLFHARAAALAKELNLDIQTLKNWVYVRLLNAICWAIEDNMNADKFLNQINCFSD